ncbi:MAG: YihA family ribosome biogenesis GTP-binding protein [Calditrichaeota bacterium]|nr:MAG: YihA family ribosome biogenesis GTP-binding protein [Calditrichota bacterium]
MKIKESKFIGSFANNTQLPKDRLPEIAFAGRSNVGKSSLINTLLARKNLARISNTPGKTQLLNYIRVNDAFYLVDLPGYGFAKVPKSEKRRWRLMIDDYLKESPYLRGVVSLIDSRHGPANSDLELISWLAELEIPCLVVATKVDKLNRKQFNESQNRILQTIERFPVHGPLFISSANGQGKKELWQSISNLLE